VLQAGQHAALPRRKLDLTGANRHGQQLFLAHTFQDRRVHLRHDTKADAEPLSEFAVTGDHEQLVLFKMRRDLAAHGRTGLHLRADPARAAALDRLARDMAAELGWTGRLLEGTSCGLRIVLGIQDRPNAPINASDVTLLRDLDLPIWPVMKVLAAAGDLVEDRTPALDRWFTQQIDGLPDTMVTELTAWYEVMKHGSPASPRRRPRSEVTIKLHLRWALPITAHLGRRRPPLAAGDHPRARPRCPAAVGERALDRRAGPQVDLPVAQGPQGAVHRSHRPRQGRLSRGQAAAASQRRTAARRVDVRRSGPRRSGSSRRVPRPAGRTTATSAPVRHPRRPAARRGPVIILAEPVRERLRAYLDLRQQRWPETANAHLFLTKHTGRRTEECSKRWIWLTIGPDLSIAAIREDRILDEANATGGDVRRLADLFGLSIQAGTRYTNVISHPDLGSTSRP
jgi:hypothetical protein